MRTQQARIEAYQHMAHTYSDVREYLPWLYQQAADAQCPIAELGVRTGRSTAALLAGAGTRRGVTVWSVDRDMPDVPPSWLADPLWHFARCDSVSIQAQKHLPPALGLLFIDTAHDYATTLAELLTYGHRVIPGGWIACHDTQWDEGDVALPEPTGPVAQALDDYTKALGWTWANLPGTYGMGVIEVPNG